MTRQQIADVLGVQKFYIDQIFEKAIKEHPELNIFNISKNNKAGYGIDYTLEQVKLAMSYARNGKGISSIESIMIEEEFTMRPPEVSKAIGIKGTEEFLKSIENYPKKRCCSTCAYCTKSTMRNRKPVLKPYCNLWERFLHRINANPYKDWCRQYVYSENEPLIFYTAESPSNVDIYGNVSNNVMGYDMSNFSKKTTNKVRLVTDTGFEDLPDFD